MNALEAVAVVLADAGGPLHYRDITQRMLKRRLWTTEGKTPWETINARLAVDLQKHGTGSRFVRVAPGTFALRAAQLRGRHAVRRGGTAAPSKERRKRPPHSRTAPGDARDTAAAGGAAAAPHPHAPPSDRSKKLGVQEIRDLARAIVRSHPEGIRYGQLLAAILEDAPATSRNTVQGTVYNLEAQFPDEITKPSRGLFKPTTPTVAPPGSVLGAAVAKPVQAGRAGERWTEADFYEPFADWLKNDAGDATDAIALGGAALKAKWGTPDVIGVYKPLPSDRIKFPHEIISAEIKIEPQAPVVAFGQAVAYRLFSTKTYIAMPASIAQEDLDRLEALCMLFGVGLVLFEVNPEQPNFRIRMRAQRFSPDMYFVNEFADGLHRHDREMFNRLFQ